MVQIAFIRRLKGLLGTNRSAENVQVLVEVAPPTIEPPAPAPVIIAACPNCGVLLDRPPDHTRLCPRCRRRIVVRHANGRAIYLTEAAVAVFEAERNREIEGQAWTRERGRWLQLAQLAGVSAERRQRVAAAPLTAASVQTARTLYLAAADRAVRAARRDKHWDDVARVRRRQAAALFEEAGGKPPPADEIVALHREGVAATLRVLSALSREAELVGASCCAACRADNGRIFLIADELRTPRLPHPGCPRGFCACDWWPALRNPLVSIRRRRAPGGSSAGAGAHARTAPAPASAKRAKPVADPAGPASRRKRAKP